MIEDYKEYDAKHIKMITDFFEEFDIPYKEDSDTIGLFHLTKADGNPIEIRYINSLNNKMDYEKRFGIKGIDKNTFMRLSKDNTKKGIRTIFIKDFEIYSTKNVPQVDGSIVEDYPRKWEVVKSYIRTATGSIGNRIYARDTEVRIVPNKELRPFLDTNCFYGYRSATINLGLYAKKDKGNVKKGELVMVYTFGHPFYGKNKWDIEVVRVATKLHCQCLGGASKLLKHFMTTYETLTIGGKEVPANRLVFYVDACHNDGKSLETLGFDFIEHNGPGFHNMFAMDCEQGKKGQVFMRMPAIHKQIMQYMAEGKVISIPTAGTIVYLLDRTKYFEAHPKK